MVKKGFLKKIGCILISASIILTGFTFFGSTTSEADGDAGTYVGNELVSVEDTSDGKYTVQLGTTKIADDALSGTNITYLVIQNPLEYFGDQDDWPPAGTVIHCINNTISESTIVKGYQERLARSGIFVEVRFKNSGNVTEERTVTYNYKLLSKDGNTVHTIVVTEEVAVGETPSGKKPSSGYNSADDTISYDGYVYEYEDGPSPSFTEVTEDGENTYTYTYRTDTETPSAFEVTHHRTLQDGTQIGDDYVESVTVGQLPAYNYRANITVDSKTYEYVSGPTPDFVAVTGAATYAYIFKESSSSDGGGTSDGGGSQGGGSQGGGSTGKMYSVTVVDEFYKPNLNTITKTVIRSVNKYVDGSSYSFNPISYTGYANWGGRNQSGVVHGDIKVYFFYKPTDSSSTTTTTTATKTGAGITASAEAQQNNKYLITKGAGQVVAQNNGAVTIVCNGEVSKLLYILVDGSVLDSSNYTIASGSTILTLNKEYIANLPIGDHVVQFQYNDGYALTGLKIVGGKATTTVSYKVSSDGSISAGHKKDTTPKTADGFDARYLLCLAIFLLGAGAILMGRQRKLEMILAEQREDY